MTEHLLAGLTGILVCGIGAYWLAWRCHVPAILFLLLAGLVVGPVTGWLRPDALLGPLLLPVVSLSVAIILFEGGLSLRFRDLPQIGRSLGTLVSLGAGVTWGVGTMAAHGLMGLPVRLSLLLGAILVVTGPTVIGPLLRHVRPTRQVGLLLKWEGIIIDPIGAMLAVLVFEGILAEELQEAAALMALGMLTTVCVGVLLGLLGSWLLLLCLRRYWLPDFLHNPATLMFVASVFTVANVLQEESGLFAVTVMGMGLANQKAVPVRHIVAFKENLQIILLASLFIMLAARLQVADVRQMGLGSVAFVGVLIVVARPLAVFLSTCWSTRLTWRERLFLAWMAPRGIVAAAVSAVFALRLSEIGVPQASLLVPLTFLVIISTVVVYGLTAAPVARWLQVTQPAPQGVLIVGAHAWARAIARSLQDAQCSVLLVDTEWDHIAAARMEGLRTYYGSILAEDAPDLMTLDGMGRLLALTSNDQVNSLATLHFADVFGQTEVYQLPPMHANGRPEPIPHHLRGRLLFGSQYTYAGLTDRFLAGAVLKRTALTPDFTYVAFQGHYGASAIPLFLLDAAGNLSVYTTDLAPLPQPGHTLISLVEPAPLPPISTGSLESRSDV